MKTTVTLNAAVLAMAAALTLPRPAHGGDATRCDKMFEEVRVAVEREPQKVLLIVEDFMVASEPCACEIVKGAIQGSKANADLTRQIANVATHVAPHLASLINECAGAAATGGGKAVVASVKEPVSVQPPLPEGTGGGGSDYAFMPGDIRGVYLIQPSTGGITTTTTTEKTTKTTKIIVRRSPPRRSVPQSPSVALGP